MGLGEKRDRREEGKDKKTGKEAREEETDFNSPQYNLGGIRLDV